MLSANSDLDPAAVKAAIRESCERIGDSPGEYDEQGHSANFGFGRVDTRAAVEAVQRM
jgi:hypothetical protein